MPSEAELRRILHGDPDDSGTLDAARIIRRARARRLPKQLAAGATGVLAVAAIAVPVAFGGGLFGNQAADTASGGAAAEGARITAEDQAEMHDAPFAASGAFACGAALGADGVAASGFAATIDSPTGAGGETTQVMVALQNVSGVQLSGTLDAAPSVALARDGVVVAVGAAEKLTPTPVELAPGAAMLLPVWVPLTACDASDAALPAGSYTLSAAVTVTTADGATEVTVGPPSPFQIRVP